RCGAGDVDVARRPVPHVQVRLGAGRLSRELGNGREAVRVDSRGWRQQQVPERAGEDLGLSRRRGCDLGDKVHQSWKAVAWTSSAPAGKALLLVPTTTSTLPGCRLRIWRTRLVRSAGTMPVFSRTADTV